MNGILLIISLGLIMVFNLRISLCKSCSSESKGRDFAISDRVKY